MEMKEAQDIVKCLNAAGWRITRADEHVSEGPLQRALGMDGVV